jgi:hypothetical protein
MATVTCKVNIRRANHGSPAEGTLVGVSIIIMVSVIWKELCLYGMAIIPTASGKRISSFGSQPIFNAN